MMKNRDLGLFLLLLVLAPLRGQTNSAQQLVFAGLRSVAQQGQINGVKSDAAGNLFLLLNQGDGVRLLKTDNAGNTVQAQALLGASGDVGVALALDPLGNVYVTGTTSSTALMGTSGAAVPARTDSSTNSFVAKFDAALNPLFVTFTGGSRIAASALSATADAVFVTGITYATNLPVTASGIQQSPAFGSSQNGFVEKFSSSGTTLLYATYLTGASGDTTPAAIVADAADNAYIVGETTASGFPTIAALVPAILSNPSGFLTKLTPVGDGITFSTFVPGAGLTSIALDSSGITLLVSGAVALGQFPVDTVAMPLVPTTYQVLLRIPVDGSTVNSATLLAPGTQSFVAAAASGGAWVDGVLSAPMLPLTPLANLGGGFAAHVPAGAAIDQTARFGGLANQNPTFASLPAIITSVAADPAGEALIAGAVQPTASSSLLASETFDLPLRNSPTAVLPSSVADAKLTTATCNGSLCAGSAAYLSKLSPVSGAALSFSSNDLPFLVLRNLGSAEADNLQLTANGANVATNCGTTLFGGGECDILLSGGMAGTLTASSTSAASQTISFATYPAAAPASTIVYFPKELDFGIQTSSSAASTATITVSNLGTASQSFRSAIDMTVNPKGGPASPFSEVGSDCTLAGVANTKVLAAGGTCHITIGLTASSAPTSDGFLRANWSIGARDVLLTGYSQAAALSVSATEVDFGTQFSNGIRLPRFLYLSNASGSPLSHAPLSLPAGSAFTLTDACPATLLAKTVCRIRIDYLAAKQTSTDSVSLALDGGLSVLITGSTLPPRTVTGTTVNPNLTVTPTAASFANPVAVTSVSGSPQTVTISNTGASPFALTLALTGDFTDTTSCGATLAGGQSCTVAVSFVPSQPGARQGLLSVTAGAGTSPAYVALSGNGSAILPANNGAFDFGSIPVNQPVTQFYKIGQAFNALALTTTGPYGVVLVEDAGFGHGQPASSSYSANITGSCHNCYLGVQFLPTAVGPQPGTLTITSTTGGNPYVLGLSGSGLPLAGLLLTPLAQDFGTVPLHSVSGTELFTLTNLNPLAQAVVIGTPVLTGDFTLTAASTGGAACGGSLAYTASCFVAVAFVPTATGSRTGTLTLSSTGLSATASLTGLAIADPGIALNPLTLTFNNVPGTTATMQSVSITNTGSASVAVGTPSAGTSNFGASSTCGNLAAGANCTIAVTFAAGSAAAFDTLSIPITAMVAGSAQTTSYMVALNGSYTSSTAGLEIVPGLAQFGPFPVDSEGPARLFTINNLTSKSLTLNINLPRHFALTSAPCGGLAPNASCSFSVAFTPFTGGNIAGTVYAQATPSDGSAGLSSIAYAEGYGSSTGALTISGGLIVNSVFNFAQVSSGQTRSQTFTLSNSNPAGSPAITIRRVTSGPPFLSSTTCGTALAVGQSCTVTVTYAPSNQVAAGTASPPTNSDAGSLTIESDAASSPDILNFSGQAAPLAVGSPASSVTLATFTLSQGSLTFATTATGNVSAPQTVTLANTGTVNLHVASVFTTADFGVQNGCSTVLPGGTCTLAVTSTPQSAGIHLASLELASDSATSLEFISLIATGVQSPLVFSPASLNFGSVLLGGSATLPLQITNTSASAITFNSTSVTGDYTSTGNCPAAGVSLAPGASCTLQVSFKPTATGTRTGTLAFANSATTNPLNVPLTGNATQSHLTVSSTSLAFGSIPLGIPSNLLLTLINSGSAPIVNLALVTTGDYAVTVPCPSTTLAAGATCTVQLTFTPTAAGARSGTLNVLSSDPSSPLVVALSGSGVPAGSFTLTVDGGASSSVSVTSGQPATYHLAVAAVGGFTGTVALTCSAVNAAQYASCALLPPSVTLGGATQTAVVTINTITSAGGNASLARPFDPLETALACLLLPGLFSFWRGRRQLRRHIPLMIAIFLVSATLFATGCGHGNFADPNVRYTPAGTYQYQVTATSTSGLPISQTVTLNLTVTAR